LERFYLKNQSKGNEPSSVNGRGFAVFRKVLWEKFEKKLMNVFIYFNFKKLRHGDMVPD
jgi:hypothetical protein